ncbi:ATP-binding protein [Curvibacter sp. APW13]|uniref:sensor histidine kinase n=1 Tax=Curvibacter sp. APW13 TaxID=3077236 RepID=UPI0028DE1469|nr:ATP-binding protein [Curvibacter sp. APW13]MDT8991948.1 ATP-binding protein [Curvibacter sp. APW13]
MRSFRLRLAVVSALLSATILVAFGAGSWWLIRNAKLGQLDSEMKALAGREVGLLDRAESSAIGRESDLASALGLRSASDVAVLAESPLGTMRYQSAQWPADVLATVTKRLSTASASDPAVEGWRWLPGAIAYAAPPGRADGAGPPGGVGGADDAGVRAGPGAVREGPFPRPPVPPAGAVQPAFPPAQREPLSASPRDGPRVPAATTRDRELPPVVVSVPAQQESQATESESEQREKSPPPSVRMPPEPQATPVARERLAFDVPLPGRPAPALTLIAVSAGGQNWRVAVASLPQQRFVVAANLRAIDEDLRGTRNGFLLVLPLALGLAGLVSWWGAGRALVPLDAITQAARRVTAEGLDKRIAVQGQDREFTELIEVFNRMLARLERSFGQANRFTADAAHELKTPLAIIQGQLERALVQAQDNPALQAALTSTLDEVQRLGAISRKLLLLAQADAGRLRVSQEPIDMGQMLADLIEDARMLAPALDIQGRVQADLRISGDETLLRQVLHNLLSNAIKYNLPEGWIRVQTARWGQRLEVSVANASRGIASHERKRLFERFYRADAAHGRTIEGVGLGLSVSREIARAHGGDLVFKGETTDGGVEFALLLPLR